MIDVHTHKDGAREAPASPGLRSLTLAEASGLFKNLTDGGAFDTGWKPALLQGLFSVGFHPWELGATGPSAEEWEVFERIAERPEVVAIGECGLDLLKGPVLAVQMNAFKRQAETASRLGKPLIIHCVKGYEQVMALKKELKPEVAWIIHGFRGKASVARMLVKAGFYLSIGEKFNPDALTEIPRDRLLVETDESELPIEEILTRVAEALGEDPAELSKTIEETVKRVLKL